MLRRARSRTGVHACMRFVYASLFQRAQREQRERSAPLVGVGPHRPVGPRAAGSLTLRFYFLRSFPPRARATPLFLDTRDTVVRRAVVHVPRTYTYSREGRLQKSLLPSPPGVRPVVPGVLSRNSFCSFFPFAADEADGRSTIGEMGL